MTDSDLVRDQFALVLAGDNIARAIAIILLIGLVYVVRRWGRAELPVVGWKLLPAWFATDRGGVVITLALSFLGAIGHALAASSPVNVELFEAAVLTAVGAAGGYVAIRRMLWPPDKAAAGGG